MAEHLWSVLCNRSLVDDHTQQISLIDVVEKLIIPLSPKEGVDTGKGSAPSSAVSIQLDLVNCWFRSNETVPEKGRARIRHIAPDGRELATQEYPIDLSRTILWKSILRLEVFTLSNEAGFHWIENQKWVEESWVTVARLPVRVVL